MKFDNFKFTKGKKAVTKDIRPLLVFMVMGLVFILAFLYLAHPAFNIKSASFFVYVIIIAGYLFIASYLAYHYLLVDNKTYRNINRVIGGLVAIVLIYMFGSMLISAPFFNAKEYASRIVVEDTKFDMIEEVDFSKTAVIDRASSEVLGDRVMGQMPELVSQFTVSDEYTQISYRDSVYRVTPLEYADMLKYFMNRDEGIPAYILVNSTTGEAELVKLEDLGLDGMRYVPSGMFNENLMRKLQLSYPTEIFGSPSFEIDDDGRPWYVCTTYTYKGTETMKKVSGVVLFDPITGDSIKYDDPLEAPKWVDRIYPESLVTEELVDYGSLQDGFINSIFGQRDVYLPSDGYNYLEKDGDIFIYTGLTSVNSDRANLGFALVNLRTHEAYEIASPGADETSAMRSAEGHVSDYGYSATFPLLVNVSGNPVYLMSLKDEAGLIKMYAMVDATDYQKVVSVSIDEGLETLKAEFISESDLDMTESEALKVKDTTVEDIRFIVSEGVTKVYITDSDGLRYKVEVNDTNEDILGFLDVADRIRVEYLETEIVNVIKDISILVE